MTGTSGFQVEIDGAPMPPDIEGLLVSAYVDDSRNLPDMFLLRFRDPERIVVSEARVRVGSAVNVAVKKSDGSPATKLIAAEVTALEAEFDSGGTFTIIRGYDPAHRLFRGRRTETYTQATASDVARKVAGRAQVPVGTIDSTSTVFDHISQCGTTDWEFLNGLAREIGFQIAVRQGKFEFRRPSSASGAPQADGQADANPLVLTLGADLLRFRAVVTSAEQVKEVEARGWDVSQKKALVATAPAKTTSAILPSVSPTDLARTFGDPTYVAAGVPYRSQAEVDSAAATLADDIASAFAEFEGVSRGNPALCAGAAFSVTNIGEPWDGKYTISSSRHVYDPQTGYTTAFSVTGPQERSLYGLASGGGTTSTGSSGVVVAQVSDANDPEHHGRVKVTFPWLSDTYVSDWARTVQSGAGKDRGAMVLPEVGDEVLVAFEHDMRRPYVIGGLFNGIDTPKGGPVDLVDSGSGAVNRRSFVSRLGHRLDFLDQKGQADGITMASADEKVKLIIDAAGTKVIVNSDGTVLIEGKTGIVLDAGQSKLELKGGEVSLTAQGNLTLHGTQAKLEGSAQTEIKGGSLCSVSAGLVKIN